jgi:hypothetical protein
MTGGLMQLVAYGAQDIYLTGNPMITYFKVVYRRHTNFAMESIAQTFNGTVGFGNKVSALISRNGDLVSGLNLEVRLPAIPPQGGVFTGNWVDSVGHYLVEEVSVEIGGQQIDKHYGDWLEIWSQLSIPAGQNRGYNQMIGQDFGVVGNNGLQTASGANAAHASVGAHVDSQGNRVLYVPLQFWFCRNVGLALPLIALQYHEVKVAVKFRRAADLVISGAATPVTTNMTLSATLWADYVYLDTDERRRFAQVSHEYLIEQLQFSGDGALTSNSASVDLNFNHPVKELVWVARSNANNAAKQYNNYTTLTGAAGSRATFPEAGGAVAFNAQPLNPVATGLLKLNGHERFSQQQGPYFNLVQTKCHTNTPLCPGINVYSFALKPEDHQPSGTCNFSRIDNAQLVLGVRSDADGGVNGNSTTAGTTASTLKVFAVNYNVLRIMSGMGGLAYSN